MDHSVLQLGVRVASVSGLLSFVESVEMNRRNLLRILVYHRIGDPENDNGRLDPTLISATPEQFEVQMKFLSSHYRLLSIADVLGTLEAGDPLPPKAVMVTFDDGYRDFIEIAWPILERFRVPALLFIPTGFLSTEDQLFWWDRLYQGFRRTNCQQVSLHPVGNYSLTTQDQRWRAFIEIKKRIACMDFHFAMQLVDRLLESLEVTPEAAGSLLSWSDVRQLNERGCSLAAHTRSHPILANIPVEEARQEIRDSRQDLRREIGRDWPVMAYPSGQKGDCGGEDLSLVMREEGIKLAMTTMPGINIFPGCDRLRLARIGLSPRIDLPAFRSILTGLYQGVCRIQARSSRAN